MKKLLYLIVLLAGCPAINYGIDPAQPATLYRHMVEINREWLFQAPAGNYPEIVHFSDDRMRISTHLRLVESELRNRKVSHLNAGQLRNRLKHLDVLRAYWQAGIFPTNHYHQERRPYFRDNYTVLCAVGYLLWQDGQHELVEKIHLEDNYGYIAQLAVRHPEIKTWADQNGFSVSDLAWIQPGYDPKEPAISAWGNNMGLNPGGRINVMAKDDKETLLFAAGSFSQIDGVSAGNIAAWDGSAWQTLGDGVVGEIFALEFGKVNGHPKLFVGGNFYLPGQTDKQNIAEYDLEKKTWKGLQTGDMHGSVYTVHLNSWLYIGGDFQLIDGKPSQNLAYFNTYNQVWNYNSNGGFQVDGPVYAILSIGNHLLTGGAFQQAYQASSGSWIPAPNLVYFDWSWTPTPLLNSLPPVRALAYFEDKLFTGHLIDYSTNSNGVYSLQAGLWELETFYPVCDSLVHGFLPAGDQLIAYGGFYAGQFVIGKGAAVFKTGSSHAVGYLLADSTITAMMTFQNQIYMSGDFQHLFDKPFPGMAKIQLPSVPVQSLPDRLPVNVIAQPDHLTISFDNLPSPASLKVFDLQGRMMIEKTFTAGTSTADVVAGENWLDGLYVWLIQNSEGRQVGKWLVVK